MPATLPALTEEYQAELTKRGLPQLSADELLHEDIEGDDRSYVVDFYNRWQETENHLADLQCDIKALDTGHDPDLVRELVAEYGRINGAPLANHA